MGFWAMVRLAQNGQPWPLMAAGKPKVFTYQTDALIAAQAHVIKHINGTMRRDGETISSAKADAAFPSLKPFVKQRGKTGMVEVKRKERA